MIIDNELRMSNDQAITGTAVSTKVPDKVKAGGPMRDAWLFVKTGSDADFTLLTSLEIAFETSDDNFAADTVVLYSASFLLAELTQDTVLMRIPLPLGIKQYIRMNYTVTGTNPGAGSIYAAIVPGVEER